MKITVVLLLLVFATPVQAATGGKGKGSTATPSPARASTSSGHHGSTLRTMRDPRRAPELDPGRKINEQDCSKPIDLSAGNLRCK